VYRCGDVDGVKIVAGDGYALGAYIITIPHQINTIKVGIDQHLIKDMQ
jgi:hypothetical protein